LVKAHPATTATPASFYLRLQLLDKPGALAKVAAVMGEAGVSIDRMRQYGHDAGKAPVLIVTHKTTRAAIDQVVLDFNQTQVVEAPPVALRIETI
jgi:homoserine dehydrogenase